MARRRRKNSAWMFGSEGLLSADDASVSIRDVLAGVFKQIESKRQPLLDRLNRDWESMAGDLTAGHARPALIRDRTLVIHADSSAWLNELVRFRRVELLSRIHKKYGSNMIKNISIKLDPGFSE